MKYAVYFESFNEWKLFETEQEALVHAKQLEEEEEDDDEETENPILFNGGIKIFKLIKESRFIEEDRQSNYKCLKEPEELAQCSVCENSCGEGEEWPHDDEIDCVGRIEFKDVKNESFEMFKRFVTDPAFAKYRASDDTAHILEIAKQHWRNK